MLLNQLYLILLIVSYICFIFKFVSKVNYIYIYLFSIVFADYLDMENLGSTLQHSHQKDSSISLTFVLHVRHPI
jgi:hypothetical protein